MDVADEKVPNAALIDVYNLVAISDCAFSPKCTLLLAGCLTFSCAAKLFLIELASSRRVVHLSKWLLPSLRLTMWKSAMSNLKTGQFA